MNIAPGSGAASVAELTRILLPTPGPQLRVLFLPIGASKEPW